MVQYLRKTKKKTKGPAAEAAFLVTETDPRAPASEAYRTVRTNIHFASLDQPYHILVVTSASAGEGKTTTTANFGVVVAQSGSRVCIIDSDLRRPALHRVFGLDNVRGLTTALLEDLPIKTLAQPTRIPNLSVLTSGPLPPNPAELVASKRMHDLLEAAATDFDLLLCDTPPVVAVSDAAALAAKSDGVVFVVRVGAVPYNVIQRAIGQIEAVKGRILGVLLNSVNLRRDGYYYDYYRYYHSYYGDGQPTGRR
jgi:capsular exopolysaccharide synthesis family protein